MMCPSTMSNCISSGGMSKVPMLLLALAAGYAVLVLSNSQQRPLDVLGRILGSLILLISFVGLLCVASSRLCHRWARCHGDKMTMGCPMMKSQECTRGGESSQDSQVQSEQTPPTK
jgi:hypothetical protein